LIASIEGTLPRLRQVGSAVVTKLCSREEGAIPNVVLACPVTSSSMSGSDGVLGIEDGVMGGEKLDTKD
jgi:hypothetical protein